MSLTVSADTASGSTTNPIIPSRQFAYLTELNPTDNSKYIEVRVYRKWTTVKVPGFAPMGFSCILLDKKGSAIQANADLKEKERFERDLQINSVYKIQGFGFEKTDSWGKTLDNDFTLCFGKYTQIDLLQDNHFPYHYFNFAAFNELNARLEKKNPILTDYIGYVHNLEKVKEYGGATTNRVKAEHCYDSYKKPHLAVIIYNETNTAVPQLEVQTERLTNWEQERNRNRVPLATLLQIDPKTQQKCDECGGKLRYGYLHGQCHQYGTNPNQENSYCFRMVITDGTGNAIISCFTPQTDGLIKDINMLLQKVEDKNPSTIPAAILALQNTRHVFQFQFATPTTKGPSSPPTVVTVAQQSEQYTPPPVTPGVTEETPMDTPIATRRPVHSTARKELFADTSEKEVGPSSPPTVVTVAQQSEEYTPPPVIPGVTQETPMDTPIAKGRPVQSTARKELFAKASEKEDDPISKKQKKE
ncbi:hypothetical protein CTI12_AA556890 [Artemisia annua]|uniref:Replication protein A 70 kDa DNA-binding subunit B/D first OB fold domain-containing protein n=1 Tax=Artemisia annua TaxID=35608 RepID=A0A2U1KVF2_ARTAN|nr:hypothetical protein CTI12_AA556890 [Artemisia annua]